MACSVLPWFRDPAHAFCAHLLVTMTCKDFLTNESLLFRYLKGKRRTISHLSHFLAREKVLFVSSQFLETATRVRVVSSSYMEGKLQGAELMSCVVGLFPFSCWWPMAFYCFLSSPFAGLFW